MRLKTCPLLLLLAGILAACPGLPRPIPLADRVEVAPLSTDVSLAVHFGVVERTIDGGASWAVVSTRSRSFADATFAAPGSATMAWAASVFPPGVTLSTDGGATFSVVDPPQLGGVTDALSTSLAAHPIDARRLLAGFVVAGGPRVFLTTDSGATWTEAAIASGTTTGIIRLTHDAADPATAYLGLEGRLLRSSDGGLSFASLSVAPLASSEAIFDIAAVGSTIYLGADQGLLVSTDAGASWTRRIVNATLDRIFSLAVEPGDPRTVYVVVSGIGLFRSRDAGVTSTLLASAGAFFVRLPNPQTIWVGGASNGLVLRSTNGGTSFAPTGPLSVR